MKVRVIRPAELTSEDEALWGKFQDADSHLGSPYLCAEFVKAVARVRDDVYIGVMEEGAETIGFFPFQRAKLGIGGPVGGRLSDCQGVIAKRQVDWNPGDLIRGCGLRIWDFDHLIAAQPAFRTYHRVAARSPIIDLSGGFEEYRQERQRAGSNRINQVMRKSRKIAREVGPLRFDPHSRDRVLLQRVIEWKSAQCRRTGVFDFFRLDWTRAVVDRILEAETERFTGMLSALYAGEHLIAAQFGMRSRTVLHWWFPVYDDRFASYSPGGILLIKLAEHAARQGVRMIDLGKGEDPYKSSFMNRSIDLAEGAVTVPSIPTALRRIRETAEAFARNARIAAPLRASIRGLRKARRRALG